MAEFDGPVPAPTVGTSQHRVDARAKVRGEHQFPSDHVLPGMLWVRVVRSSRPHALLTSVDTLVASAIEGVECILTAADVPGNNAHGLVVADQPVLCSERVRYVGEPIALVAATTDQVARKACAAVEVHYRNLSVVSDSALSEQSEPLHCGGNVCAEVDLGFDDPGQMLSLSEECFEIDYNTDRQEHAFLETEAGTSWLDEDGILNISAGGQNPFNDRRQIVDALGLEPDRVRVVNPMMGGAFGGKEDCSVQILLALVTFATGRPARLMFDRDESMIAGVKRHAFQVRSRVAATRDGRLTAFDCSFIADAGAYTTLSPAVITQAAEHASGPYRFEACRVRGKAMHTNNGNASAFRGFGNPQMVIGIEQLMDEIAVRTGLSPFDVRRKNLIGKGQTAGAGHTMISDTVLPQLLDAAEQGELWRHRSKVKSETPEGIRRGIGVTAIWQGYGLGAGLEQGADVRLSLTREGTYLLQVGTPDLGAGNITAFLQIAADMLGCAVGDIDHIAGDSLGPDSGSSNASRTIFIVGNAIAAASHKLRRKIVDVATSALGPGKWDLAGGFVCMKDNRVPLPELVRITDGITVSLSHKQPMPEARLPGFPHAGYSYWVQVMAVDVDVHTGEVSVNGVENYVDVGKAINPDGVKAQCEGGFAQGVGYALYENSIFENAVLGNPTLSDYIIPSIKDVPVKLDTRIFETADDTNPLGVRGIAEIGLTPVAVTVANAVHDAIGVRFSKFPILPEMVLEAILAE